MEATPLPLDVEIVALAELHPHPGNYRTHPEDQLDHLKQSLIEHGVYRPLVLAQDNVILAGHGVYEAARQLGWTHLPASRLPLASDDPRALKLLVGDNEIAHLGVQDDRRLTELLRELHESDMTDLLGTGFDPHMLGALVYVSRPASEIPDKNEAQHWVGMPAYESVGIRHGHPHIVVHFENLDARTAFLQLIGRTDTAPDGTMAMSIWWPEEPAPIDAGSLYVTA